MEPVRLGVIGVGNISGIYLQNLAASQNVQILSLADLDISRAERAAIEHGVTAEASSPETLLANPEIEAVLNLTVPKAHATLNQIALRAGKHVYVEKPLAVTRSDGRETMNLANAAGLKVGCAPDTFLGAAFQTAARLIDEGQIGEPVGANAFMLCHGHESWHPSPAFYYEAGGGPMLDMGPYYLTALVSLLGPVKRVQGSARATFPTRSITSSPLNGAVIPVETPTHLAGVLDFSNGAIGQITTSFDVWRSDMPLLEVYGTEGSLALPDPNGFGGEVRISRRGAAWETVTLDSGRADNARGLGVEDWARAIRENREPRASGRLAYHVLDIMQSVAEASGTGEAQILTSTVEKPFRLGA